MVQLPLACDRLLHACPPRGRRCLFDPPVRQLVDQKEEVNMEGGKNNNSCQLNGRSYYLFALFIGTYLLEMQRSERREQRDRRWTFPTMEGIN